MYLWLFSYGSCGIQKSASLAVLWCFPTWHGLSHDALSSNPPRAGVINTWHCVQFLPMCWGYKFISTWLLCEGLTPWAVSKFLRFIVPTGLLCSTHIWMERFHPSCRKAHWDLEIDNSQVLEGSWNSEESYVSVSLPYKAQQLWGGDTALSVRYLKSFDQANCPRVA